MERSMELDDFINKVNDLSKPDLLEEKIRLEIAIARIQLQLQSPHPNGNTQDWRKSARTALRFKQIELEYINDRIHLTSSDLFLQAARRLLDPDTFNIIMEQASA